MTTGDGLQSGGRASEAELLKRLAERRTDFEQAQAETRESASFARFFSRRKPAAGPTQNKPNRWEPRESVGGLRRRPVAAYLTMTLVSAVAVGAVALLAMSSGGDAASNGPAAMTARAPAAESAATAAASAARTPVEAAMASSASDTRAAASASDTRAAALETPVELAVEPVTVPAAETDARLRLTTEDLPKSAADAPAPTSDAVAVALALRLPSAPSEATTGLSADLLTTGSITSLVGQRPIVSAPVGADGTPDMARWAIPETDPVSEPTAGYDAAEIAASETTAEEPAVEAASGTEAEPEAKPTASVKVAVNLRAKPDNGAKVIAVLPKGRTVEVHGCKLWCEVSADGKRGFVFKSFVSRRG
ncbi:SH3 domain-containing protein [Aurantimonas sp. C2-6-R+9]|uniref:SH3 domain-containing protein n=1 Tax=unclassified Aurantimonas TaxID=2638230 RepID=UPI002E18634F|nr:MULTISPECIES: SH3 domain-containing protein [unclassified Aurantimonas]MEC5291226.1 SH3 domain-containing protein [Aurantimonas sp. C2-3-R2]MEC5380955.1 SH3 domain-containing protein [Aurantimonas sp. C2-6-R+9]MEC5412283.1 SH3 domain-containing protein [Aurantimonas sp. C2-4-R8]